MIETRDPGDDLARRLERFRAARAGSGDPAGPLPHRPIGSAELADRLATTLDGEVVSGPLGRYVRVDRPVVDLPVDRVRLAGLPGQPDPDRPLVCLDTETTGLATATGTVAFCIGLGWWEGSAFRQVQLLLPDHADEPALLDELARHIPAEAWLVTYNGRGFDWPLRSPATGWRGAQRRSMTATSTCCRWSGGSFGTGWPTPACARSRPSCSTSSVTTTWTAGRSRSDTWASSAADRHIRCGPSSATTMRTSARWRA